MMAMAIHKSRIRPGPFGGTLTTSVCGRLNARSSDGMNITEHNDLVTCKFCLRRLSLLKESRRHG